MTRNIHKEIPFEFRGDTLVYICMFWLLNPQTISELRQQGTVITVWHEAHHLLAQQLVLVSIPAPVCE